MLASLCLRALRLRCQTAASAMIDDYLVCRQHWGFDPSEMRIPVIVWHGRGDWLVPLAHTLKLAALIPTSTARVDPTAGHFFYRDRLAEIVEGLLPTGSPPGCASYLVAA